MEHAQKAVGQEPLLELKPYKNKKVGIVVTGSEVFAGRIEDKFGPTMERKMAEYDAEIIGKTIVGDDPLAISETIKDYLHKGADMINYLFQQLL